MYKRQGHYSKKLSAMAGLYEDEVRFSQAVEQAGDSVIYRVSDVRPVAFHGDLIFGTTFMKPGRIGNEFFMTRGHIHAKANRPETYYGESGEGLMLLESPEGATRVLEVLPRQMIYVPPFWIHRSVNIGSVPLVLSFCYPSDSGQDYSIIERSGGMASRIVADGLERGPKLVIPPARRLGDCTCLRDWRLPTMNAFSRIEQYTVVHVIANDAAAIDRASEIRSAQ